MSIGQVVRAAVPWLSALLVFLAFITYVPQVSLWLPNLGIG
jgi:C4-dicarboxylate transporter DctM subunit